MNSNFGQNMELTGQSYCSIFFEFLSLLFIRWPSQQELGRTSRRVKSWFGNRMTQRKLRKMFHGIRLAVETNVNKLDEIERKLAKVRLDSSVTKRHIYDQLRNHFAEHQRIAFLRGLHLKFNLNEAMEWMTPEEKNEVESAKWLCMLEGMLIKQRDTVTGLYSRLYEVLMEVFRLYKLSEISDHVSYVADMTEAQEIINMDKLTQRISDSVNQVLSSLENTKNNMEDTRTDADENFTELKLKEGDDFKLRFFAEFQEENATTINNPAATRYMTVNTRG